MYWTALLLTAASFAAQEKKEPPKQESGGFKVDVPLLESLTIGGQIRIRGEFRDIADYRVPGTFGRPASDHVEDHSSIIMERTRVHFDANVNEHLRAFIQFQDSRTWGEEATPASDTPSFDMKQGFIEVRKIFDAPLSVKAGRMEVPSFGDARLFSGLDWNNVGRSWDGLHTAYAPEGWALNAMVVNLAEGSIFGSRSKNDYWAGGMYASCKKLKDHEFDAYLFLRGLLDDDFASETGGPLGPRHDYTLGLRGKGKVSMFDYSGEIVGQFGDQNDDRIGAWALALTAGVTFEHDWKPRIGLEYAFASGDDDPADGKLGTFDPLFPFGHFFHGHMDLIGWRNIHAFMLAARANPCKDLSVHLDFHAFRLAEDTDGWYNAAGTIVRRDATGSSDAWVGYEIDLYAKWKLFERLDFWAGYSHFFAGSFVKDTGEDRDQDWIFLQVTLNI